MTMTRTTTTTTTFFTIERFSHGVWATGAGAESWRDRATAEWQMELKARVFGADNLRIREWSR